MKKTKMKKTKSTTLKEFKVPITVHYDGHLVIKARDMQDAFAKAHKQLAKMKEVQQHLIDCDEDIDVCFDHDPDLFKAYNSDEEDVEEDNEDE